MCVLVAHKNVASRCEIAKRIAIEEEEGKKKWYSSICGYVVLCLPYNFIAPATSNYLSILHTLKSLMELSTRTPKPTVYVLGSMCADTVATVVRKKTNCAKCVF